MKRARERTERGLAQLGEGHLHKKERRELRRKERAKCGVRVRKRAANVKEQTSFPPGFCAWGPRAKYFVEENSKTVPGYLHGVVLDTGHF